MQVLGKLIAQRQLPKLWEARSRLVELFDAEREGPVSRRIAVPSAPRLEARASARTAAADLVADLGDRLVAALEQVHQREERVDHVVVVVVADGTPAPRQRLDVREAVVAQRVVLGGDHDRRRQPGVIGGSKRRDLRVGSRRSTSAT